MRRQRGRLLRFRLWFWLRFWLRLQYFSFHDIGVNDVRVNHYRARILFADEFCLTLQQLDRIFLHDDLCLALQQLDRIFLNDDFCLTLQQLDRIFLNDDFCLSHQ